MHIGKTDAKWGTGAKWFFENKPCYEFGNKEKVISFELSCDKMVPSAAQVLNFCQSCLN